VRLIIAEDQGLLRESLALAAHDVDVVGAAGSLPEVLRLVDAAPPNAALLDIRMPLTGTDEGLRAAEAIRASHPEVALPPGPSVSGQTGLGTRADRSLEVIEELEHDAVHVEQPLPERSSPHACPGRGHGRDLARVTDDRPARRWGAADSWAVVPCLGQVTRFWDDEPHCRPHYRRGIPLASRISRARSSAGSCMTVIPDGVATIAPVGPAGRQCRGDRCGACAGAENEEEPPALGPPRRRSEPRRGVEQAPGLGRPAGRRRSGPGRQLGRAR
jgi:CheY-like chemotaxis protein